MLKPKKITNDLMAKYAKRVFKVGGLIPNNFEPSIPIPESVLEDMKFCGIDYIITSYPNDNTTKNPRKNLNAFIDTLGSADKVHIDVYSTHDVFAKNKYEGIEELKRGANPNVLAPENICVDKIHDAMCSSSFKGIFHDKPTDLDEDYEEIRDFNEIYKNECSSNLKIDVNLYPNYLEYFDEKNSSFKENVWNTGRKFNEYVKRFARYSDTIGTEFFPIHLSMAKGKSGIDAKKVDVWSSCLNTLLKEYKNAPEKDFCMFMQSSEFFPYGVMTNETLSIQAYSALIGGANNIRFYALADNNAQSTEQQLNHSPYKSNNDKFDWGQTRRELKYFLDSKFKVIKNFVVKKYIDEVAIYDNNHKPVNGHALDKLDEFVEKSKAHTYNMFSIGYDGSASYCFVVNLSELKESSIFLAGGVSYLTFNTQNGSFTESKTSSTSKVLKNTKLTIKPGDICILKKPYVIEAEKNKQKLTLIEKVVNVVKRLFK